MTEKLNTTLRNVFVVPSDTIEDGAVGLTTTITPGTETISNTNSVITQVEDVKEPIFQYLDPNFHQTLIDHGKQYGFWPWISRFRDLFGYKQLLNFLLIKNSIWNDMEALNLQDSDDSYLQMIRHLFDITVYF
jgi:hypothetical protein